MDIDRLYRTYGPMVLRRCRRLLRDEDQALDAMQDVFARLLQHGDRLTAEYPSSLLYRMATNLCLNRLRERRGRPPSQPLEDAPDELVQRGAHCGEVEARFDKSKRALTIGVVVRGRNALAPQSRVIANQYPNLHGATLRRALRVLLLFPGDLTVAPTRYSR